MLFTWQCLIQSIVFIESLQEYWCPCKHSKNQETVPESPIKTDRQTGRQTEKHTQRPLADHTPVDQWDNQTKLAGCVSMEMDPEQPSFQKLNEDQLDIWHTKQKTGRQTDRQTMSGSQLAVTVWTVCLCVLPRCCLCLRLWQQIRQRETLWNTKYLHYTTKIPQVRITWVIIISSVQGDFNEAPSTLGTLNLKLRRHYPGELHEHESFNHLVQILSCQLLSP